MSGVHDEINSDTLKSKITVLRQCDCRPAPGTMPADIGEFPIILMGQKFRKEDMGP